MSTEGLLRERILLGFDQGKKEDGPSSSGLTKIMKNRKRTGTSIAVGSTPKKSSLASSTQGAVLPEFVVVIGPLLVAFFSLLQLTQLYVSNIVIKNATLVACRAASVTQPAPGGLHNPDGDEANYANLGYLVDAARASMTESDRTRFQSISPVVNIDAAAHMTEVRMDATFHCTIPLGWRIACGGDYITLHGAARMPYHGVRYDF